MDGTHARNASLSPVSSLCWLRTAALALSVVAASLAGAPLAKADFTEVATDPTQVFDHAYGGTFKQDGLNFSNGDVTAARVDDGQDQIWHQADAIVGARAIASFAFLRQSFGFYGGTSGGTFTPLFDVTGTGFNVGGESGALPMTNDYRVARGGEGDAFSSRSSDNRDGRDHLITYAVTGLPHQPSNVSTWMLFWEDVPAPAADFDFNDLVVELKTDPPLGVGTPPVAIPLPPAVWTGLSGLIGLATIGACRRLRPGFLNP